MPCNLDHLPNEILIQILTPFSTRTLVPLVSTSARFCSLVLRILHYRLLLATSLPSYELLLEAYHPTCKNTEPYLFCTYLGTPGLSPTYEGEKVSSYDSATSSQRRYANLGKLYSRFRPERPGVEEGNIPKRSYPGGGSSSQNDSGSSSQLVYANCADGESKKIEHVINIDSHELFSQFCTIANLVKVGPRRGVFLSLVNVEDKVMRVWREWLKARAKEEEEEEEEEEEDFQDSKSEAVAGELERDIFADPSVLWTDHRRNVGLVVSIRNLGKWRRRDIGPILISADEEQPVSYSLEIRELIVRTTHLMLAVEDSAEQQINTSGKAMIFGSFADTATTTTTTTANAEA